MAPPTRLRRETRMDAAIEAMGEMGFKVKLVRSTVNELLKVYKGTNRRLNPWKFMEEGSYILLIEQLLQKTEAEDAIENMDAAPQDEAAMQEHAAMQEGAD